MKLKSLIITILSSLSLSFLFGCAKSAPEVYEEHKLVYKGYRTMISEEIVISSKQSTSIEIKPKNKRYGLDTEHSYAPQINYIDKDKKTIGGASFVYNKESITITFDKIQVGIYAEGDFELSLLNESQIFPETDYEKHGIDYIDESEITELVSQPQPINPYEESTGFAQTKGSYRFLNGTKPEDINFTYIDSNNTPVVEHPIITSVDRRNIHFSFPTIPEGKYASGNFKLAIINISDLVEYTGKHELIYKDEYSQLVDSTYLSIDTTTKAVVRGKEGYILNGVVQEKDLYVSVKSQKGKPDPTVTNVTVVNRKINITINKIDSKIDYGDFTLTIGYKGGGSLFVEAPPATLYLAPDETTSNHARFGNYESEQPEVFEVLCYTEVKMIIFPAPDTNTEWWDPAYWLPIEDATTEKELVDALKSKLFAERALREEDVESIHVGVNEAAQSWLFVPSYEVTLYLDYDYYHALHPDDIITIPGLNNLFITKKPTGKYQYTYEGGSTEIIAEPTSKVIDLYSENAADRTITIKPKANTDGIVLKTFEDDLLDAKRAFEMSIQFSYIYNPFDGEYLNLVLDRNANTVSIVFDKVEEGYYPKFYGHLTANPNLDRLYRLPDDHEITMEYDSTTSNMMSFRYPEDITVYWKDRKFLYDEKINTILGASTNHIYDEDFYMSPRPIGYDEDGEPIFDHYIDWYNQDFTDRFRNAITSSYALTSNGEKLYLDFDRDMSYNPTSGDTYDFRLSYIFDYPFYKANVVKVVLCNFNDLLHDYGPGNYA